MSIIKAMFGPGLPSVERNTNETSLNKLFLSPKNQSPKKKLDITYSINSSHSLDFCIWEMLRKEKKLLAKSGAKHLASGTNQGTASFSPFIWLRLQIMTF